MDTKELNKLDLFELSNYLTGQGIPAIGPTCNEHLFQITRKLRAIHMDTIPKGQEEALFAYIKCMDFIIKCGLSQQMAVIHQLGVLVYEDKDSAGEQEE